VPPTLDFSSVTRTTATRCEAVVCDVYTKGRYGSVADFDCDNRPDVKVLNFDISCNYQRIGDVVALPGDR
jgi:hypothetical protein